MIFRSSPDFDLGRDHSRIKDPRDGIRQQCTVDALLERFFHPKPERRFEIQVLADEVGMGKTFVALGVAYSILAHQKENGDPEFDGCYRRVLILTPSNHALYSKWIQEVGEFMRRCVPGERRSVDMPFAAVGVDHLDELAIAFRKPGRQPQIIVARMGFGSDKLCDSDIKRRFTLGALFRFWGVSFNYEYRERLLRGAPQNWPSNPDGLSVLTEGDDQKLPFTEDQFLSIIRSFTTEDLGEVAALLDLCRELAQPFYRNRDESFRAVEKKLLHVYRLAAHRSILKDFPLLIVDEAHNWKNGPSAGTNGFEKFSRYIAPHVRRALLLTATPFQLRPDEMLEILKLSDFIRPCTTLWESEVRRDRLKQFRENVVRPVLANAERHSKSFSKTWAKVPSRVRAEDLAAEWVSGGMTAARDALQTLAKREGAVSEYDADLARIISDTVAKIDPDVRQFFREALFLYVYNADLSRELGKLVIRHRRQTDHRRFRIGVEFGADAQQQSPRPDAHILHAAPGLDIRGESELPQFLLMRCVSEMKGGRGRSSLACDLTGCYSTLQESAEGRKVNQALGESVTGRLYLKLLFDLVNKRHDHKHPKVAAVVDRVLQHWRAGEKVLIFCFRVNTAERLRDIISDKIRDELMSRRRRVLGGEERLKTLRARLTGRDRDLITLGLDRVLWSLAWDKTATAWPLIDPEQFRLRDDELPLLARLSLLFDAEVIGDRVDRVFLNRATEHVLAQRFLRSIPEIERIYPVLRLIGSQAWVAEPYGLQYRGEQEDESEEIASFDERGVHTKYSAALEDPDSSEVQKLAEALKSTRQRARTQKQMPVLDSYALAPSLWLGADPPFAWRQPDVRQLGASLQAIHKWIWQLTRSDDLVTVDRITEGSFDWYGRALAFQAMRRTLLRDSILLRLLPQRRDLDESGWGELLAKAFFENLPHQHESMARRIAAFLEDLSAASGHIADPTSARGALYQATRLREQQFVALVKGGGGNMTTTRERVFNGFNTPLLPEVLICTQVGQEGIDLHRQCRHVIHYDLAWNPAVLEQRTGRADRIGSKTFRERDAAGTGASVFLEVGVPFLAGTYDERMYEELRLRAQTFEVLTGGDFTADHAGEVEPDDEGEHIGSAVIPLPQEVINDLRVRLQVWDSPAHAKTKGALATF